MAQQGNVGELLSMLDSPILGVLEDITAAFKDNLICGMYPCMYLEVEFYLDTSGCLILTRIMVFFLSNTLFCE